MSVDAPAASGEGLSRPPRPPARGGRRVPLRLLLAAGVAAVLLALLAVLLARSFRPAAPDAAARQRPARRLSDRSGGEGRRSRRVGGGARRRGRSRGSGARPARRRAGARAGRGCGRCGSGRRRPSAPERKRPWPCWRARSTKPRSAASRRRRNEAVASPRRARCWRPRKRKRPKPRRRCAKLRRTSRSRARSGPLRRIEPDRRRRRPTRAAGGDDATAPRWPPWRSSARRWRRRSGTATLGRRCRPDRAEHGYNAPIRAAQIGNAQRQQHQAQAQIAAAHADANQARAQRRAAQASLSDLTVRAAGNGTVIARAVEPGDVVAPGRTLLSVVDLDRVYLRGYVPEGDIGRVRVGQARAVYLDSDPSTRSTRASARSTRKPRSRPRTSTSSTIACSRSSA